ncbi:AhpC/TSA family protein [Brevibacillus antibioticus]|uniref:thioredoxin-dependent peroxiredoxin n=1 Tax=Brevibacillus antibioticus TaxID=2570228 RepID=A0A4U2Y8W8_9BACL|nr:peroxiredoxin-like family protein [Brevibacillus antibioticus]TKI57087.1 AhpC/TSA family protein [Brevibacillus antibioticus]
MDKPHFQSLREELDFTTLQIADLLTREVTDAFTRSIEELRTSWHAKGLPIGSIAPDFTLNDHIGKTIALSEEVVKGPVVLTFFRGSWCPYCNLELQAYQQQVDTITSLGAQLFAISPQSPAHSLAMQEKNGLSFPVLCDTNNRVAEKYKLRFRLPDHFQDTYRTLDIDLKHFNSDDSWTLPIPATYILDNQGVIRSAYLDPDYKKRMEPTEVLDILRTLT